MTATANLRLGHYDLTRPLAHGGMADLYLAKDRRTGATVAVKILSARRAEEPEICELFLHEGRLVQLLVHDNIAAVFDAAYDAELDLRYIAMEWIHGADLREIVNTAMYVQHPIDRATAVSIVLGAGAGLDHAHRATTTDGRALDLVHRDVSLSNIMIGHDGSVKLVDFGIARTALSTVATAPGVVRGKASYMAPEQCLGDPVDRRTDVFALGIVLYELTTGVRCFGGDSDFDRMMAIVRGDFVRPRELDPDYPEDLECVVLSALGTRRDERFQSVAAMCTALARVGERNGWALGADRIRAMMRGLYGDVASPAVGEATQVMTPGASTTYTPDLVIAIEPISVELMAEQTSTSRRRVARGTEGGETLEETGVTSVVSEWDTAESSARRRRLNSSYTYRP